MGLLSGTVDNATDCKQLTISTWFNYPLQAGDSGALIEFGDDTNSEGPSGLYLVADGSKITNIAYDFASALAGGYTWFLQSAPGFPGSGFVPAPDGGIALGVWHHLMVALDATAPYTVPDVAYDIGLRDGIVPKKPTSCQVLKVYIDGIDCSPFTQFVYTNMVGRPPGYDATAPVDVVYLDPDDIHYFIQWCLGVGKVAAGVSDNTYAPAPLFRSDGTTPTGAMQASLASSDVAVFGHPIGVPCLPDNAATSPRIRRADTYVYFGRYIDPAVDLDKFLVGTKPANPAVPLAVFGTPAFLWKGDKTHFAINLGDGGDTASSGTVNDFTPGPG